MKYKTGQILPSYLNYQEERGYEGEAELLEFKEQGLPFVLHDAEHLITYSYEKWLVRIGTHRCIRKFRYRVRAGKTVRNIDKLEETRSLPKDSFLSVRGVEIY